MQTEHRIGLALGLVNIALLAFLVGASVLYLSKYLPNDFRKTGERQVEVHKEYEAFSTLTSTRDNLSVIFVRLRNFVHRSKEPFVFSILDEEARVLRKVEISGANIGDGEWTRFQFTPLTGIKDRKLTLKLHSDSPYPSQSVIAFTDPSGEFLFKSFGRGEAAAVALENLTDFANRFFADKTFALFYVLIVGVSLAVLLKVRKNV